MSEGPSQMDMWDYKPKMADLFDKDLPESIHNGQRLTTMTSGQTRFPVAPTKYKFARHGKNGVWVSELLPWTAKIVDELAIVKTVWTEAINHDPAITYICTGHQLPGRASLGSWLSYGLGTTNENLPAFVVMTPSWTGRKEAQALFNRLWGSGFLPSKHQGVALRSTGDPILFLGNPPGVSGRLDPLRRDARRSGPAQSARARQRRRSGDASPHRAIRDGLPHADQRARADGPVRKEPANTFSEMYGPDVKKPSTFAASCLLARRLVERGVRFVQLFHRGWDQHANLPTDLPKQCQDVDQACYGLITDLKQRGLLDDTLVVWGGEFGRTIYCQGKLTHDNYGRDHHPRCNTVWMAGSGGIKGGIVHGETDDFSYNIVENPVHIHDMNATILHCLGIDHRRLTYKFQGLDMKLTGTEEHAAVQGLLA